MSLNHRLDRLEAQRASMEEVTVGARTRLLSFLDLLAE